MDRLRAALALEPARLELRLDCVPEPFDRWVLRPEPFDFCAEPFDFWPLRAGVVRPRVVVR